MNSGLTTLAFAARRVGSFRAIDQIGAAFWDERYASRNAVWSGEPNGPLVAECSDLMPGHAFEAAAGEERITWFPADLRTWTPNAEFDLACAHFMQLHAGEARPRVVTDRDGNDVTVHDSVLRARRVTALERTPLAPAAAVG